jgi:hypothetical protein
MPGAHRAVAGTGDRRRHRTALVLALAVCAGPIAAVPARAGLPAPDLATDTTLATAGFYRLSWTTTARQVELQEAADAGFQHPVTLYTGPDHASLLSGKPDGTWFYRVRAEDGNRTSPWSRAVRVTVAHHSLVRAVLFLSLGILVFLSIVLLILRAREAE